MDYGAVGVFEVGKVDRFVEKYTSSCQCLFDADGIYKEPCLDEDFSVEFSSTSFADIEYCEKSVCEWCYFLNQEYCEDIGFDQISCGAKIEGS